MINRLARIVLCKYSTTADYERAMSILIDLGLYDGALRYAATQARVQRWQRQCNTVVSQKERQYSETWFRLKLHKETDEKLEDWIIGKSVGVMQRGLLVVTLNDVAIPVMPKEYAQLMTFYSFDGKFTLVCDDATDEMMIATFTRLL